MKPVALPFSPPNGFDLGEVMFSFRGPEVSDLKDPRAMQTQTAVRPNLIAHKRPASGADIEMLTAEMCAELLTSIDNIEDLATDGLTFSDGNEGRLVSFTFPAGKVMRVRQYQALRLDGETLTTLTLTVDGATLTDGRLETYMSSMKSLTK